MVYNKNLIIVQQHQKKHDEVYIFTLCYYARVVYALTKKILFCFFSVLFKIYSSDIQVRFYFCSIFVLLKFSFQILLCRFLNQGVFSCGKMISLSHLIPVSGTASLSWPRIYCVCIRILPSVQTMPLFRPLDRICQNGFRKSSLSRQPRPKDLQVSREN